MSTSNLSSNKNAFGRTFSSAKAPCVCTGMGREDKLCARFQQPFVILCKGGQWTSAHVFQFAGKCTDVLGVLQHAATADVVRIEFN